MRIGINVVLKNTWIRKTVVKMKSYKFYKCLSVFVCVLILYCKKENSEEKNIQKIGSINSKIGIRLFFEPIMGPGYRQLNFPFGTVVSILETIPPEENRGSKYEKYS